MPRRPAPRRPNPPSVLVVLPAVLALGLAVAWAQLEAAPW